MTPLAIDQWGWSNQEAITNLGITMACGGILSGFCFALIVPLSKKFDERILLLVAGLVPMILGRVCMFPLGNDYHVKPIFGNGTVTNQTSRGNISLIFIS